jgi:hypothetical protein
LRDVVTNFRGFCGGYGVGFDEDGVDENGYGHGVVRF